MVTAVVAFITGPYATLYGSVFRVPPVDLRADIRNALCEVYVGVRAWQALLPRQA